jgi:hypothetical protein
VNLHGTEQVRTGEGQTGLTGSEQLTEDQVRRLQQSRIEDVSPEYRKQVEQYYRNLGRPAGQTDGQDDSPQ